MQVYDLPDTSNMTAEEATQAANAMAAAGRGDKEHPYFLASHPQHTDFVAYSNRLTEIRFAAETEAKQQEQDAAIRACPEVDSYASTEDAIKTLEATPDFMSGELRQTDRARHDAILAARDALYERAEAEKVDDEQTDA